MLSLTCRLAASSRSNAADRMSGPSFDNHACRRSAVSVGDGSAAAMIFLVRVCFGFLCCCFLCGVLLAMVTPG